DLGGGDDRGGGDGGGGGGSAPAFRSRAEPAAGPRAPAPGCAAHGPAAVQQHGSRWSGRAPAGARARRVTAARPWLRAPAGRYVESSTSRSTTQVSPRGGMTA